MAVATGDWGRAAVAEPLGAAVVVVEVTVVGAVVAGGAVVVEIWFDVGSGQPFASAAMLSSVDELVALEPSDVARKLAGKRVAAAPFPVEFAGLDGAQVPLDAASVDTVVSTWTLCTIPDRAAALAEVARVLKPGGRLLFLEHGLSDDERTARWQRRLNGLQMRLFGGCRLDVPIDEVVEQSALHVESIEEFTMGGGPKVSCYLYRGVATKS